MTALQINFLAVTEISPELNHAIDTLDLLAFGDEHREPSGDPEFDSIEWAAPDWMVLGFMAGQLVSQLCLHQREITVGAERVWVAGVGGVATHPDWRRRGLASQVLRTSEGFMRATLKVPFGLLVCAAATQPVYTSCGWQTVAKTLTFVQADQPRQLETCVMIRPLTGLAWPVGAINLCGLPW